MQRFYYKKHCFIQVQIDFLESEEIQCTGPPEETDPLLDVLSKKVEELVS